ncbi:hypothetical protein C8R43DRAFT_1143365 [Mycena crocata]|nr:hypothetical protein C8R43DRAFT_1143365 [Mycena crocata]
MEDILVNDDEAEEQFAASWVASEWIGCGRQYHDVPQMVEVARRDMLKVPPSITKHLPSKEMSIAKLLVCDLPPTSDAVMDLSDDFDGFLDTVATTDVEELLTILAVPDRDTVRRLTEKLGQAWFDGKKAFHTFIHPDIAFPFWVLTYWSEILDAAEAKDLWIQAASWLEATGKTEEEVELKHTVKTLWKIINWHGLLKGFAGIEVSDLAGFFSKNYLGGNLVDAMLELLSLRLIGSDDPGSDTKVIVNTNFAQFIGLLLPDDDGNIPISSHDGAQIYLKKYGMWFRGPEHTHLDLVLYRPPQHWTACSIDFKQGHIRYGDGLKWPRPKEFFEALKSWTKEFFPGTEFRVTDDLPCAIQTDSFNCPIIAVNAVAHDTLGDPLWTSRTAKAMRMKAFCDISKHGISSKRIAPSEKKILRPDDLAENLLAVVPDINDIRLSNFTARTRDIPEMSQTAAATVSEDAGPPGFPARGLKRVSEATTSEPTGDDDARRKRVKLSESSDRSAFVPGAPRGAASFCDPGYQPKVVVKSKKSTKAKAKPAKPKAPQPSKPEASSSSVGISRSAAASRNQREQVRHGTFKGNAKRTEAFRLKCRGADSDAGFEETSSQVQCSKCKRWFKMKEPYNTFNFTAHRNAEKCAAPPPEPSSQATNSKLDEFGLVERRPEPKNPPRFTVPRPCPGLTRAFNDLVGNYLDRTVSTGGGGHNPNHYSHKLFGQDFTDLREKQKESVHAAHLHDYAWRNDTSPGVMACFATGVLACLKTVEVEPGSDTTPPCASCQLLLSLKTFKNAISREPADPSNLRYVPHAHQNAHAGFLYAKFKGLERLISEDNEFSVERRYFQHVIDGDFKDDKVFNGLIQAKVLAKDREIRGVGKQNFKYDSDLDSLFGLIHTISPRAYRELAKHFPAQTERSIKHVISTTPRFPIGITDENFHFAQQYCENYQYPLGAPLSLSVDDTKLFPALRPLYDDTKQKWFIVGTAGNHIEVPNTKALHDTLDELQSGTELATKLRLWVLQIPLPGVPPLVVAIQPMGSKVKGDQLAEWQIQLMEGLILRGFRITSSGGDGAAVERDCQRRTASASKLMEYRIKHPDPQYPDIIVQIWELDGNIWTIIQDAKHGLKTFRNNVFSGAHSLTLGNFVVFFRLIHTLGMKPKSPLYRRDFIKSDRMDDPAASRFFSADFLQQAAEDP